MTFNHNHHLLFLLFTLYHQSLLSSIFFLRLPSTVSQIYWCSWTFFFCFLLLNNTTTVAVISLHFRQLWFLNLLASTSDFFVNHSLAASTRARARSLLRRAAAAFVPTGTGRPVLRISSARHDKSMRHEPPRVSWKRINASPTATRPEWNLFQLNLSDGGKIFWNLYTHSSLLLGISRTSTRLRLGSSTDWCIAGTVHMQTLYSRTFFFDRPERSLYT